MTERPDTWRKKNGCRVIDRTARADDPITILGQENFLPFCPGYVVDSAYLASVYELERFMRANLTLGNALELPYPVADSLAMLGHARDLERAFRRKEEEHGDR